MELSAGRAACIGLHSYGPEKAEQAIGILKGCEILLAKRETGTYRA